MKQKITIEVDVKEGYQLTYNPATKTIEEVPIKHIKSKSWKEFCKNHPCTDNEYFITNSSNVEYRYMNGDRSNSHSNTLASKKDAEGILALIQLTRLHDEWVGDWKPDYSDIKTEKWYIYFSANEIDIAWTKTQKRFLAFPTGEMAKEFLECFKDLIEQAKKFI